MEQPNEQQTSEWVDRRLASLTPESSLDPDAGRAFDRFRHRRDAVRRRHRSAVWVTAGVAAAAAGGLAFPEGRAYASRCVDACVVQSERVLSAIGGLRDPGSERPLAPDFRLAGLDGRPLQLSSLRGKVVLLNFWATWCNPCRVEIPWFADFHRRLEPEGLAVVGVSLDEDWNSVRPFAAEHGMPYPVVQGDEDVTASYGGVDSLPTTFILDRKGRVASMHVGLVSKDEYEQVIRRLLAEK